MKILSIPAQKIIIDNSKIRSSLQQFLNNYSMYGLVGM